MKVIGGQWRGRRLDAPRDTGTRPSASRLREALFSALLGRLTAAHVLDLFAGSGALGIEALSRGADFAEFVEIDPRALKVIAGNLERLGADPSTWRLRRGDAKRFVQTLPATLPESSVLVMDPPWEEGLPARYLPQALRLVDSGRIQAFALEHPANAEPAVLELPDGLDLRCRRHGQGAFTLLTRSPA